MFAGGVDMDSVVNLDVERLEAQDVPNAAAAGIKVSKGDTMMRIVFYNGVANAKCAFFDLVPLRALDAAPAAAPAAAKSVLSFGKKPDAPNVQSNLKEDAGITSKFVSEFKTAIFRDTKYDYAILDSTKVPPIHYSETPYLYPLPAGTTSVNYKCYFTKGKSEEPVAADDQDVAGAIATHQSIVEQPEIPVNVNASAGGRRTRRRGNRRKTQKINKKRKVHVSRGKKHIRRH